MRTLMRRGAAAAAFLAATGGAGVLTAAPAMAGCPYETDWVVTGRSDIWMLTSTYSYWMTGPGTITYSQSATASRGTTKSASIGVSAGTIIVKAEAKYSMDWNESTSRTSTWSYNISIPSGQTARAAVYKKGSRFTVQKWTLNSNCSSTYGTAYYQYSPFAATDNAQYCVGKDPQPGTQFVYTSGCGH